MQIHGFLLGCAAMRDYGFGFGRAVMQIHGFGFASLCKSKYMDLDLMPIQTHNDANPWIWICSVKMPFPPFAKMSCIVIVIDLLSICPLWQNT